MTTGTQARIVVTAALLGIGCASTPPPTDDKDVDSGFDGSIADAVDAATDTWDPIDALQSLDVAPTRSNDAGAADTVTASPDAGPEVCTDDKIDPLKWPKNCQELMKPADLKVPIPKWPPAALPELATAVHAIPPVTVTIPAGPAYVGRNPAVNCFGGSTLQKVWLSAFEILKYPVTNAQYAKCVAAGVCPKPYPYIENCHHNCAKGPFSTCRSTKPVPYRPNAIAGGPATPVDCVEYKWMVTFCKWLGSGWDLPTYSQAQKAARGGCEFAPKEKCGESAGPFPWSAKSPGLRPNCALVCAKGCPCKPTQPVGSHPAGASPYGVQDLPGHLASVVRSDVVHKTHPHVQESGKCLENPSAKIPAYGGMGAVDTFLALMSPASYQSGINAARIGNVSSAQMQDSPRAHQKFRCSRTL